MPTRAWLSARALQFPGTLSGVEDDFAAYVKMQSAFLDAHGAPYLGVCARAVAAGLAPSRCTTSFTLENWRFPPGFLPVYHFGGDYVGGAWISDPISGAVDVIEMLRELPVFAAVSQGRTGLRLLVSLLEMLGDHARLKLDGERGVRAFVDFAFEGADPAEREALVGAALQGFDPDDDVIVCALPVIRRLWSSADAVPAPSYAEPLPEFLARGLSAAVEQYRASPQRPAFESALAAGDVPAAWGALNRSGWTYDEVLLAFEELAPRMHPDVASIVRVKLDPEIFGPTLGF